MDLVQAVSTLESDMVALWNGLTERQKTYPVADKFKDAQMAWAAVSDVLADGIEVGDVNMMNVAINRTAQVLDMLGRKALASPSGAQFMAIVESAARIYAEFLAQTRG